MCLCEIVFEDFERERESTEMFSLGFSGLGWRVTIISELYYSLSVVNKDCPRVLEHDYLTS